jgi:alpha-L-rhamnosidase
MKLTDPALARFRIFLMIALLGSSVLINCGPNNNFEFKFEKLLVEYAVDPINIDIQHPRFSWVVSSDQRNQQQSAYQIIVASNEKLLSNNKSDLWNSGKIISDETIHHEYEGIDLQSNTHYFWKVIFWDKSGTPHESPIAKFETALLNSSD